MVLSRPFFFISLWFRRRIVKLLGLNFGLGVVSMIETWCSCCIGVVSTSFYPISSILDVHLFCGYVFRPITWSPHPSLNWTGLVLLYVINKFCYCRNRRRALWRKHSILLEKWIKQYKLGRIRQVAILNSPVVTSWRTESSNISLVVLDKLLYYSRNLVFFIFQNFLKTDQPTNQPTDIGTYIDASRRLKIKTNFENNIKRNFKDKYFNRIWIQIFFVCNDN